MKMVGRSRRYALLLAARDSEFVKEAYGGYYNVFVETYGEDGEEWDAFRVVDGEFPEIDEIHQYDGFVISGSPYDAYGSEDWIAQLTLLVQIFDSLEKKVLGICFGHQLICRALGGKVGRASGGWDVGLREVKLEKDSETPLSFLLGDDEIPSTLPIIEIHQDAVLEPPADAQVVGSSDKTAVEMFTIGHHILGIQGHPEYNKDILFNLIDRLLNNKWIEEEMAEKAKIVMEAVEPDRKSWEKMCRGFLKGRNDK